MDNPGLVRFRCLIFLSFSTVSTFIHQLCRRYAKQALPLPGARLETEWLKNILPQSHQSVPGSKWDCGHNMSKVISSLLIFFLQEYFTWNKSFRPTLTNYAVSNFHCKSWIFSSHAKVCNIVFSYTETEYIAKYK